MNARTGLAMACCLLASACRPADQHAVDSSRHATPPGGQATPLAAAVPVSTVRIPLPPDYVVVPQVAADEAGAGPRRIVSTAPQLTEILCALGLRDRIVGRSSFCDHPPEIAAVPSIGGLIDLNTEVILSLEPDLVVVSGQSRMISERLAAVRVPFVSIPDASYEDIFAAIRELGRRCGRERTAAALEVAIRRDVEQILAEHRTRHPRRVLLHTGTMPTPPAAPFVAGPGSYLAELLERVGHKNAAAALGRAFGQLPLEEIIAVNPEVIIELQPTAEFDPVRAAESRAAWRSVGPIRAVQDGHVYFLVGNQHYLPGPRVAMTLRALILAIPDGESEQPRDPPK